jgi:Bacterial dipeptidyl-peptidase Sh3 domain/NlpC/P60 family
MSGVPPDPRRHAYRAGLAAESLRGLVEAPRYVEGVRRQVEAPALPLRREPRFDAILDSEALFGEALTVFEESEGWAWVQLCRDAYVGYMPSEGLTYAVITPTHRVAALRTYVYASPDIKKPPLALLSLNALLSVAGEEGRFLALNSGGFVIAEHLRKLDEPARDFVDVALGFRGTPYLWGGRTSLGVDCSGLVQLASERHRHAGARSRPPARLARRGHARPRRSRVLGRPCRHHDERARPRSCVRLSDDGGGRASGRGPRSHRRSERRRPCWRAARRGLVKRRALTLGASAARRTARA